jgi:hypothetical protein
MTRLTARWLRRLGLPGLATLAGTLVLAAPAAAATSTTVTSQNWSGYAAHGSTTKFETVSARWRVPAATCVKGEQTFSSFWVGIGGYSTDSDGLEQDGTELDCNLDGTQTVSAWYELLPAAPHTVNMTVTSGDLIAASVHVTGAEVTLTITDLTRGTTFTRTVKDSNVDDTSAEWIAEAPSDCSSDSDCTVLPLADFGAVRFSNASATTTAGVTSGIATRHWTTTKLLLGYEQQNASFVALSSGASATPTALGKASREFEVAWSGSQGTLSPTSGSSGSTGSGSSGPGGSGDGGVPNPGGGGFGGGGGGFGGPGGGPGQNF